MVVDRFSKMHHNIPCSTDADGITAEEQLSCFFNMFGKFMVYASITIISDRGPHFISNVWNFPPRPLKIKAKLSTACYSETYGQSKMANQEITVVLEITVSPEIAVSFTSLSSLQ